VGIGAQNRRSYPPIELPDGRHAVEIAPGRIIWWQTGDRWKTSSGRVS